jgi:membrane protein
MARAHAPARAAEPAGRSWLSVAKSTVTAAKEDNITDHAAALTYYGILSIFPAMIALVSLVGLLVPVDTITRVITDTVRDLAPDADVNQFVDPAERVASNQSTAGVLLVVGLAVAIWSASGYVGAFMRASNAIYEEEDDRPFWKLRPFQLAVTVAILLMAAAIVLALILSGPLASSLGEAVGLGDTAVQVWQIAKWPVLIVLVMIILSFLYWSSPRSTNWRLISAGALLAVVVWIVASALFAFYVANFGSYDKTYGTLGGVIVFLLWLWITNLAVLLGAELNSVRDRRAAEGA